LPVASIEDERTMMNQLLADNPAWAKEGTWDRRWVPFLADGDGQYYCIDPGGSCNAGKPGQVLFYDHESGPEREFTSFDAFVGLLTALAKKKLLSERAREDKEETIEALTAEAKAVGLPKLPPKQLKAVLQQLEGEEDEPAPSAEQRLALLEPLVRQYGAEEQLWSEFATAAAELERWPLVIEAASTAYRIAPKDSKPWHVPQLALALHRTGKDEEALGWLRKAVEIAKNPNSSRVGLIHHKVEPAFRARCLQLITELHPGDSVLVGYCEPVAVDVALGTAQDAARAAELALAGCIGTDDETAARTELDQRYRDVLLAATAEGFAPVADVPMIGIIDASGANTPVNGATPPVMLFAACELKKVLV
jgi:tetratricopeptide (TPR) repeat protein